MEHPSITRANRTGYSVPVRNPHIFNSDGCDVCDRFAAVVRFGRTRLCESCAREEEISLL